MICHFSSQFFIKIKDKKLSEGLYRFFLFIETEWKNRKLVATLVILFSFIFLLKRNYRKFGDRYAIYFIFFIFLNKMEKIKKWRE